MLNYKPTLTSNLHIMYVFTKPFEYSHSFVSKNLTKSELQLENNSYLNLNLKNVYI